jgi:LysR family transcriptional regulator, hydrogen peroxide-inducible genes activator
MRQTKGEDLGRATKTQRLLLDEGHCLRDQALAASSDIAASNRHATSLEILKYMVAAGEGCTLVPIMAATDVIGIKYAPLGIEHYSRVIYFGLAAERSTRE